MNRFSNASAGRMMVRTWTALLCWFGWCSLAPAQIGDGTTNREFVVSYTYDSLGRVASIQHPGTNKMQAFTYNSGTGHDVVRYDGVAVVTGTDYTPGGVARNIQLAAYQSLAAGSITNLYDTLNRPLEHRLDLAGTRYRAHTMTYDDWGFLASQIREDPGLNLTFSYDYGDFGELRAMTISDVGTTTYDYDDNGNLIERDALSGSGLDLPPFQGGTYDDQTNRKDGWIYDADGKLLQDDRYSYAYNDLEQVETVTDLETGWMVAHYLYDGNGERVREVFDDKVVYSIRGPGGMLLSQEIHQTRLDGGMDITRKDFVIHNGRVLMTATHHPDGGVTRQYSYRDRMGHPAVTVDEENGFAWEYREYAPYGHQMMPASGSEVTQEYTGHERDVTTGLDYMHARYYDSGYGRFTRPDPGFDFEPTNPYSYNMYSYARNNPVNGWDPDGTVFTLQPPVISEDFLPRPLLFFREAVLLAGSVAIEPVDWYLTGKDIWENGFHPSHMLAMLPIIPGAASKIIRKLDDVPTNQLDDVVTVGSSSQRAATREAKRQAGIPVSQQPVNQQSATIAGQNVGRQQTFETPKPGGGVEIKSVQVSRDLKGQHAGQSQIEAGTVKVDPSSGKPRLDVAGRPKLNSDKVRVDFNSPKSQ